jgi:cytoskeletal protein CcmA (bactofilin family)
VENPITKTRENIPWSYNNLDCDASKNGCGRTVPQFAIHLIGTGISNGVVRHVEAVIHVPPFPYAIASSGKFESTSGLIVASVKDAKDAMNGALALSSDKLIPCHLASNSKDNKAMKLGNKTKITGDVRSSGGIEIDPDGGTIILGKMIRNADAITLPSKDVTLYDPKVMEIEGFQSLPASMDTQKLEGVSRSDGDLTVNGDLTLDGGMVYVNGSLTVHGCVKGKGGLFVKGRTTIDNGAKLDTANTAVLFSKGDVSLGGMGKSSSAFQGMIYTEGNFTAKNITLLGSYVANGNGANTTSISSSKAGDISLENVDIIGVSDYTKVSFDVKLPPKVVTTKTEPQKPDFNAYFYNSSPSQGLGGSSSLNKPDGSGYCVGIWGSGFNLNSVYDSKTDRFNPDLVTGNSIRVVFEHWNSSGQRDQCVDVTFNEAMANYPSTWSFAQGGVSYYGNTLISLIKSQVKAYNDKYQAYKEYLAQLESGGSETTPGSTVNITVDMNEFLKLFDKMRVVLWKEWEPVKK